MSTTQCLARIESRRGRAHRSHKAMSSIPVQNADTANRSTFAEHFGMVGVAGYVRAATATLLGAFDVLPVGKRNPKDVMGLKADVRAGKKTPVAHLMRLIFAAIDAGVPVQRAVACLEEMRQAAMHYAARRERRALGVIPFRQVLARLNAHGSLEQGEAEAAMYGVDENDPASLRRAEEQLMEELAIDETRLARIRERRLELEARG